MFTALALCALTFAAAGVAGGLYLACRFDWPRQLYDRLFDGRP
jgi:hypothetical protein